MFFVASKIVGFLAYPTNELILIGLFGLVLTATRLREAGIWLMGASVALLALAGLSPVSKWLLIPLEDRFPPWNASAGPPDGIVVLGGAIPPELSAYRRAPQLSESAERITSAVALARAYPNARLIYSGGSGGLVFNRAKEADQALILFESLGLPRERIAIEPKSRNTAENAAMTKALAHPRPGERWLLVTSAFHMPRAVGAFRRVDFPVEAYPVDWRTRGGIDLIVPYERSSSGLERFDRAVHEWVGLLAYWLSGRTSELLSGPPPPATRAVAARGDRNPRGFHPA